jgi:predicted adenylyl cyclase CyaB
MAIEIEKKYRLTKKQRQAVLRRLPKIGARLQGERLEENTLYGGDAFDLERCVLRLRRIGELAILTYKERLPTSSAIKHQREEETHVKDADAMEAILKVLGFTPVLIYEKRRVTWLLGRAQIVIDELPFGLYMEIEAQEAQIREIERKLGIKGLKSEQSTYPQLARKHGKPCGNVIEARF